MLFFCGWRRAAMDLFSTLTAGAARFDKKRFGRDMSLFQSSRREEQGASQDVAAQRSAGAALPAALDFSAVMKRSARLRSPSQLGQPRVSVCRRSRALNSLPFCGPMSSS